MMCLFSVLIIVFPVGVCFVYLFFSSVLDGTVKKSSSGESRNRDRSQRASSDPQLKDLCGKHTIEETVGTNTPDSSLIFPSKIIKSKVQIEHLSKYLPSVLLL